VTAVSKKMSWREMAGDRHPLRIAITHPTCWPEVRRGSERLLNDLSHFLAARGHEVAVISTAPEDSGIDRDGAVHRILLPRRQPLPFSSRAANFFHVFALQLRGVLRSHSFDAVHCLNYHDAWGAALARGPTCQFRLVYQATGLPWRRYFRRVPLDGLIFRAALRHADAVATISHAALGMLKSEFGRHGLLLPPPTDTEPYAGIARPPPEQVPRILFAGDLDEPRKGALLLARAFVALRSRLPAAQLEYSGRCSAATRAAILAAVPQRLHGDIAFLGLGQIDKLPLLYARATVVVNPAIWEALGMVLVEALAAGTPVVGCDHSGTPDIIDDPRIGTLFAPGSIGAMAGNVVGLSDALVHTIELARRPDTAALCRRRAEAFSWQRLGPVYEAVLTGSRSNREPADLFRQPPAGTSV
jgi:phosphatidylinositol alpha-mannosyltransferase